MLTVNSASKLTVADFFKNINDATCLPKWMKSIFKVDGGDLRILKDYKYDTKPPAWFSIWHDCALTAWHADEWELTTGSLRLLPHDLSVMTPDGVSVGSYDPNNNWVPKTEIDTDDNGVGGLTAPTEQMKRDLNASTDQNVHYGGAVVKPASAGKSRGSIVVVNRWLSQSSAPLAVGADEFTSILFHELFHAGRISRGEPSADKNPAFKKTAEQIQTQFSQCPTGH